MSVVEAVLTLIVIPIFVGVAINKLSKDKKEKNHQSIGRSSGGFTFSVTFKFKRTE